MNILPLIFGFLLLFSSIAFAFIREVKTSCLFERNFKGYARAEKAIYNALAKRPFEKIKQPPSSFQTSSQTKVVNKRGALPPIEPSKFHLRAIHTSEPEQHPLYLPLSALLKQLYSERLFSKYPDQEGLEFIFASYLIKKTEELPHAKRFTDLYPTDPVLKQIFYQMAKGTNYYSKAEGIPPLAHFFSLEKADKALFIAYTSERILEAFFTEEIKNAILLLEKTKSEETKKSYSLSKQEFQALINKDASKSAQFLPLESFISYTKHSSKKKALYKTDKTTKIGIEKEI
ncbi:MAG: hypothetical protein RLZZ453_487 [Chlamydiota bacterium]|jgi:hypothetical protein